MIVVLLLVALVWLPFAVLTGLGEHRRGARTVVAVLAGVAFPLTWVVWYVRDEHPFEPHPPAV
jgi:hypothetical protein